MGLTVTMKTSDIFGNKRVITATLAFDASYPTGGEPLAAVDLGLSAIDFLFAECSNGYLFDYDHANAKMVVRNSVGTHTHDIAIGASGVVQGANNSIVWKDATHIETSGTGAAATITTAAAGSFAVGPGSEVGNTVSLASLTEVRIFAIGS
jgi:hypothetical protein